MALVDSLLSAIVRADGDALVLHAGERPYVVAPSGQSELASRGLTLDAMQGIIAEIEQMGGVLEQRGMVDNCPYYLVRWPVSGPRSEHLPNDR